ncbi:MAG: hypothetical protein QM756_11620 [Polyangiaceae bacterium]
MPATHIVRPGEHLGSIAEKFGFENFSMLWDHPENARLKALRGDPFLLAPGDKVFVPDHTRLIFSRITNSSHDVRVRVDALKLNLRILQIDGQPRKNASVTIRVEPPETGGPTTLSEQVLTTDGDGNLSVDVAKHVTSGSLVIDGLEYPLSIGQLDPVETESGVEQRLINFGLPATPRWRGRARRFALRHRRLSSRQRPTSNGPARRHRRPAEESPRRLNPAPNGADIPQNPRLFSSHKIHYVN